MKIYFNNYDVYEFDMINHIIFKNKNVIYSSKCSPLEALLNIFYININKKLNRSLKNKNACLTSKFLENFISVNLFLMNIINQILYPLIILVIL